MNLILKKLKITPKNKIKMMIIKIKMVLEQRVKKRKK